MAGTGIAAKVRALPNDVAGCTLEMGADGLWTGNLGTLTQAQHSHAGGMMGKLLLETHNAGQNATGLFGVKGIPPIRADHDAIGDGDRTG